MGYGTRDHGIRTFWPDNTPDTLYIDASYGALSLAEIIEKAKEYFGQDIDFSKLSITGDHIKTDCLGYDEYDPSDYTDFIRIELKEW